MNRATSLPKINIPVPHSVVRRERLCKLLDEAKNASVIWVSGLPGAGKTTLIADYLLGSKHQSAWLQADVQDEDSATFFHYLGLALDRALPRARLCYPAFEQEYSDNPIAYTRLFFRYIATRLPNALKIVIDNAQELSNDKLTQIIATAAEELPENVQFIVISRQHPPTALARLQINQKLYLVGTEKLYFTRHEAAQLFSTLESYDETLLDNLYSQCAGWAAGLILYRAKLQGQDKQISATADPNQFMFGYFAHEVFEHTLPKQRDILLRTAHLSQVPLSVAENIAGKTEVKEIFEFLCRHNLFTHQVETTPPVYEYHALFREFLLAEANTVLTDQERRELYLSTARLLNQLGYHDTAINLWLEAGLWDEAVGKILARARLLCSQGRHQTLSKWLTALPESIQQKNPWLSFWLGEANLAGDEASCRKHLEAAYHGFVEQRDTVGQLLTSATMLEAIYFGFTNYLGVDKWIEILKIQYQAEIVVDDGADELRILAGRLLANVLSFTNEDDLDRVCRRIEDLIQDENIDINRRVSAATALLGYFFFALKSEAAKDLVSVVTPMLDSSSLGSLKKARWFLTLANYYTTRDGAHLNAKKYLTRAKQITTNSGLHSLSIAIDLREAVLELRSHNISAAERLLTNVKNVLGQAKGMDWINYHYISGLCALTSGSAREAIEHLLAALQHCERIACPNPLRETYWLVLALAYVAGEDYDHAVAAVNKIPVLTNKNITAQRCIIALTRACVALRCGQHDMANTYLSEGLSIARKVNFTAFFNTVPYFAQLICEAALVAQVETEFVAKVAAERKLLVPQQDWQWWPWPIKIKCLGQFELVIGNTKFQHQNVHSPKLINLLKGILAYGGRDAPTDELVKLLWPGEGRIGGQTTLDVSLHRLRKLLGGESALIVKKNLVSLNPEQVWIDAWALEAQFAKLGEGEWTDRLALEKMESSVLSLYRGHFLPDAPQSLNLITPREELWKKVRRYLLRLGAAYEASGKYESAISLYRFGIERDQLASELYFALMQVLIRASRPAEALNVYTSCTRTFRSLLGKEAGEELRVLVQTLHNVQAPIF